MATKIKIKVTGKDAEKLMNPGAGIKDAGFSGYRETSEITRGGKELMDENPQSRQAEDTDKQENSDITKRVKVSDVVPTSPEARNVQGFDTVRPVDRELPTDYPEAARRRNNMARDMRTNLGRGKPAHVNLD